MREWRSSEQGSEVSSFDSCVEEELPARKAVKPRKKAAKKDAEQPEKPAFVKPTFVQRAFNAEGLRVAKEARPALMEALNEAIQHDIDRIKQQLPTFQRGAKEGEKQRVTIKSEDVALARGRTTGTQTATPETIPGLERELDTVSLDDVDPRYQLAVVLRTLKAEK